MRRLALAAASVGLAAALADCGGSSGGGGKPGQSPNNPAPSVSFFDQGPTLDQVAAELHGHVTSRRNASNGGPSIGATEEGCITIPSKGDFDVATFGSNDQRDSWVEIAKANSAIAFTGDRFAGYKDDGCVS